MKPIGRTNLKVSFATVRVRITFTHLHDELVFCFWTTCQVGRAYLHALGRLAGLRAKRKGERQKAKDKGWPEGLQVTAGCVRKGKEEEEKDKDEEQDITSQNLE